MSSDHEDAADRAAAEARLALRQIELAAQQLGIAVDGSSCRAMAERLGVSRQSISRWARGDIERVQALRILARGCGVTPDVTIMRP